MAADWILLLCLFWGKCVQLKNNDVIKKLCSTFLKVHFYPEGTASAAGHSSSYTKQTQFTWTHQCNFFFGGGGQALDYTVQYCWCYWGVLWKLDKNYRCGLKIILLLSIFFIICKKYTLSVNNVLRYVVFNDQRHPCSMYFFLSPTKKSRKSD